MYCNNITNDKTVLRATSVNFRQIDNNEDALLNFQSQKNISNPILDSDEYSFLKEEIENTKDKQGLIGIVWDGFKNFTGMGAGSSKALQAVDDFKKGKISFNEMQKAIDDYKQGQNQCVDMVADIASGIAAFGTFSLATGAGIVAAPFTGGASLGLVAAGFAVAGGAGAGVKTLIKGLDCAVGGREYTTLGYDFATGGINGMFAPITAGIGGFAGKTVANKLGVQAIKEGGEIVLKEGLEGTLKGSLTKTLLTTNVKYVGGTTLARGLSLGSDMAVNGAITGGVDSAVRYLAGDEENKNLEDFIENVEEGTITGLITAPIIGGGMRLVGNGIGKITGNIETNYKYAKEAFNNQPKNENPDMEIAKKLFGILNEAKSSISELNAKNDTMMEELAQNLDFLSDDISKISQEAIDLNSTLNNLSKEKRDIVIKALKDIAQGKDTTSVIYQLAQKGIDISEITYKKIDGYTTSLETGAQKILEATPKIENTINQAVEIELETAEKGMSLAFDLIETAQEIPNTKAYEQLGSLPDRLKAHISTINQDAAIVDDMAQNVSDSINSGNGPKAIENLEKYYEELNAFEIKLREELSQMANSASESKLDESMEVLSKRLIKLFENEKFQNLTPDKQAQAVVESSNILLAKFAQTFSTDESIPRELREQLQKFTSECISLRDISQAQEIANKLYGEGKYTLIKAYKAGTIGETYLAKNQENEEVIIKMLKEGVSKEKFKQDREMFTRYIEKFVTDEQDKSYKLGLINSMFDAWESELNFELEAMGGVNLSQNASRYSVATALEVGTTKEGEHVSLVLRKAQGVQLDNLLEMIEFHNQHPEQYLEKYSDEIAQNPLLSDIDAWKKDLANAYQKAQNEQVMFVGSNGTRTIHADPHAGNVYANLDPKTGKITIEYIDTGNTVTRTNEQTLDDIILSLNMMFGNAKSIASAMLDGATLPQDKTQEEILEEFTKLLNERLYNAGVNLKNTTYTQNTINEIMKELNIVPNGANSNLMKATLQRIETLRAINRTCETPSKKSTDIKDLMIGVLKSFKYNPKDTTTSILPIMKWVIQNKDIAMRTFFQMIMKTKLN